jgi:hypothetical protein
MVAPRTARQVIDQAIRDNKAWEYLCYALVILFGILGASVIIVGLFRESVAFSAIGVVTSYLLWPALSNAREIRTHNMLIRLYEVPLSRATTAQSAAEALRDIFIRVFADKKE